MKVNRQLNTPTYFHFLDRELRRAENAHFDEQIIFKAIIVAVLKSLSYCYCSASILQESQLNFPKSVQLLLELERFGFVKLLTNEHSYEEFIFSRQKIYAHKSDRYPMYFQDSGPTLWPTSPQIINSSTTNELRKNILGWLSSDDNILLSKQRYNTDTLASFEEKLVKQKEKAITLDLILNEKQLLDDDYRRNYGRVISTFYTQRYLELFKGNLLCNLPYLTFYDQFSTDRMANDFILVASLLDVVGIPRIFYGGDDFNIVNFITFLSHETFKHIQIELLAIIKGLVSIVENEFNSNLVALTRSIRHLNVVKTDFKAIFDVNAQTQNVFLGLNSIAMQLNEASSVFNEEYNQTKSALSKNKKVLIVVATDIEANSFFEIMSKNDRVPSHREKGKLVYWTFGILNNCEISLIKTNMGSSGSMGSTLVIQEAIVELDSDLVIMIGIAFGLKPMNQNLGDILISKQLENYELSKVMEEGTIPRADKISAGPTLLSRFEAAALVYPKKIIRGGLVVSGDKLVDSKEFIEKLRTKYPEAIGGEMEGTGLQSACHRAQKEWILMKGICDWGYDKQHPDKDRRQIEAINNVAEYLLYTFKNFTF